MTRIFALVFLGMLGLAWGAQAQVCQVPNIFVNGSGGTVLPDANQLNANFAALETCLVPATTTSLGLVQPDGSTITINGQGVISASSGGALSSVPTNAALMASSTLSYPVGVWRLSFSAPPTPPSPPEFYQPSTLPCSLNSGAGDNGSQVLSSNGLCWIQQHPVDAREYGACTTPTANSAAALNAALLSISGAGGGTLHIRTACSVSSTINLQPRTTLALDGVTLTSTVTTTDVVKSVGSLFNYGGSLVGIGQATIEATSATGNIFEFVGGTFNHLEHLYINTNSQTATLFKGLPNMDSAVNTGGDTGNLRLGRFNDIHQYGDLGNMISLGQPGAQTAVVSGNFFKDWDAQEVFIYGFYLPANNDTEVFQNFYVVLSPNGTLGLLNTSSSVDNDVWGMTFDHIEYSFGMYGMFVNYSYNNYFNRIHGSPTATNGDLTLNDNFPAASFTWCSNSNAGLSGAQNGTQCDQYGYARSGAMEGLSYWTPVVTSCTGLGTGGNCGVTHANGTQAEVFLNTGTGSINTNGSFTFGGFGQSLGANTSNGINCYTQLVGGWPAGTSITKNNGLTTNQVAVYQWSLVAGQTLVPSAEYAVDLKCWGFGS